MAVLGFRECGGQEWTTSGEPGKGVDISWGAIY